MFVRIAGTFVMVAALAGTAQAQTSKLMGQVSYPDRVQLGKTAVLEVTLEDVSDPASNRIVIATTRVAKPGHTPVVFSIEYDAALVKPAGRYALRAHIADAGAKVFESAAPVRVLTQGAGSVASITLIQVESPAPAPKPAPESKPTPEAKVIATPKPTPEPKTVAALETKPPKPTPAPKPTPEPKPTPAPKPAPVPKSTSAPPPPAPSTNAASGAPAAFGTVWTMVEIHGKPVGSGDSDHRKMVLAFDAPRGIYSGKSGCIDPAGNFAKNGAPLTPASGKSSPTCRVDEQVARTMRSALQDTRGYRITNTTLELLNAKGERVAKLER